MSVRAYVLDKTDDDLSTRVSELDDEALGEDPVEIDVEWSSLNFKDSMVRQPGNRVARRFPLVPGIDLAGTVRVGAAGIEAGQAVIVHGYDLGVSHHGGFAERARVPADWVVPLPAGMSTRQAATVGTAGFTAAMSVRRLEHNGVGPGDGPVLVTGATGGVGSMAVSLLASRHYEVVASTGKAQEHDYLRALGAAEVIGRDEVLGDDRRVLGPERWAAVVDCVGGATLAAAIRATRYGGSIAASGLTGGTELSTTVFPFITRAVSLLGIDSVLTPIDERRAIWAAVAADFPAERTEAMVAGEVGLEGLDEALTQLSQSQVRGRILVDPRR